MGDVKDLTVLVIDLLLPLLRGHFRPPTRPGAASSSGHISIIDGMYNI